MDATMEELEQMITDLEEGIILEITWGGGEEQDG